VIGAARGVEPEQKKVRKMNGKIGALVISALMLVAIVPAVSAVPCGGTQVAQVASAGPFEEARERWLTQRADWLRLYSEWLSARADFMDAIVAYKNHEISLDELIQRAKDSSTKASNLMIKGLQNLKIRIEASRGLSDEEKALLYAELDSYISELQAKQAAIQSATTWRDVRDAIKELWNYWQSIRVRVKQITAQMIVAGAETVVQRLNTFAGKVEAKIQELKDNGVDTSALENWLADFNSKLDNAEERIAIAENRISEITDNVTFMDIFRATVQYVRQGLTYLRNALRDLRDILSDLRSNGHTVVLSGSGTLIASGSGSAYINGTGVVRVIAVENSVMIVSPNAHVKTDGIGTKENLENGDVKYQGFGWARVAGTSIIVTLSGNNITLHAHGTGTAILTGTGSYRTYGESKYASGSWGTATTANLATGEVTTG